MTLLKKITPKTELDILIYPEIHKKMAKNQEMENTGKTEI